MKDNDVGRTDLLEHPKSEEIDEYLQVKLDDNRYRHVLSARDMAVELAGKYGADLHKVNLAALLHDCAKWMTTRQLFEAVADYDIQLDEFERISVPLLHALVGAELALEIFSIADEEILSAVRSHTKGNRSMTLVEKVLFVADFAEPEREYPEAEIVRKIANEDLNQAVCAVARYKIEKLLKKQSVIHPDILVVYNEARREIDDAGIMNEV